MIQEAYCSYEVAKLLKEKGFNEPCLFYYFSDGKIEKAVGLKDKNTACVSTFSAPTHQMARAWLRQEYYIYADPIKQGNYNDCSEYYTWIVARMGIIHRNSSVVDKLSYEEAVEAALKYSLENLI